MKFIYIFSLSIFCSLAINAQKRILTSVDHELKDNAKILFQQGLYNKSLGLLTEYLERNPYDAEAYIRRALIYDAQGNQNLMVQDLETANYLNPLIHLLYSRDRRNNIIAKQKYSYDWMVNGNEKENMGFKKSLLRNDFYNTIIDDDIQSEDDSILQQSLFYIESGNYSAALQTLISIDSNPIIGKYVSDLKGIAEMKLGNIQEAIDHFSNAVDIDPSFSIAYHNRSICYKLLNDLEAADADLNRAISINSNYASYYFTKALLNEKLNNEEAALTYYEKVLETDESYTEATINYSMLLKKLGRFEESIIELDQVINNNPDKTENYFLRGNIHFIYGEYEKAIDDFDVYLRDYAIDAEAHYNKGVALTLLGKNDEGCEALHRSYELGFLNEAEFVLYNCE